MSLPDDDVVHRGRAIFEQLRAGGTEPHEDEPTSSTPEPDAERGVGATEEEEPPSATELAPDPVTGEAAADLPPDETPPPGHADGQSPPRPAEPTTSPEASGGTDRAVPSPPDAVPPEPLPDVHGEPVGAMAASDDTATGVLTPPPDLAADPVAAPDDSETGPAGRPVATSGDPAAGGPVSPPSQEGTSLPEPPPHEPAAEDPAEATAAMTASDDTATGALAPPPAHDNVNGVAAPPDPVGTTVEQATPGRVPGPVPLGIPPDAVASLLGTGTDERCDPASLSPTRFARPLPRVMAIANQKGGVGKTTTAVNLGAGFAELGHRVLVVDLDPQGNATTGLGINPRNLETSIYDVMMHDVPLDDCIEPTTLRNLFVCPATIDLAGAEIELVPAFSRELKLRRALEQVLEDFDFVVVDCPPSLGLITVNALAAATEVIVPIQCEYYALEGLGQLLRNVKLVQTNLNPRLEVSAIVLTMFDARTKLADQVATEVRNHFGPKVCRNIVPRTVRLSEAPSFGQPILVFDPMSRGAIAYRELAKEVSGGAPQRVG